MNVNQNQKLLTVNIQSTYCWWCFYFKTLSVVSFDEIKSNGWLLISVCLSSSSCVCDNKEQHVFCLSPAGLSKNTCSRFHGFINKTVQQSMKTSFFSAQSHWLSLSCCVAAIILRALALCFAFVCVCTIFCVLLQISGGLFRNVFAGRRGGGGLLSASVAVRAGRMEEMTVSFITICALTIVAPLCGLTGERRRVWDYLV